MEQSAHYTHTKRRAAEIKALIEEHEKLLEEYERARKESPTAPELPPTLMLEGNPVFIGKRGEPLPDSKQPALRERLAVREDYLAVELPFEWAYFPKSLKAATPTQAAMLRWRQQLSAVMQRLREHFVRSGRDNVLSLFPLAGYGVGLRPSMKAQETIVVLERHVGLLMKELEETDEKEYLLFRLWRDVPGVLREARSRSGDDREKTAQRIAAAIDKTVELSGDAVKTWESATRRASKRYRPGIENYVLESFGVKTKQA